MKQNKKGFTLVELIVVIAIIGILATVLIPSITGYIQKAKFSNDQQDAANMSKLVQAYSAENKLDVTKLTPNEIKTIILSSGKYNLKARENKWTFVWNIAESRVEALYYDDLIVGANSSNSSITNLATSSTLYHPEEVLKDGYYLIGKGNTEIEEVVDQIRNYDGSDPFETVLSKIKGTKFSSYYPLLRDSFNPETTFYINEFGTYTKATQNFANNDSVIPDNYVKLTNVNYDPSDRSLVVYFRNRDNQSYDNYGNLGSIDLYKKGSESYVPLENLEDTDIENVETNDVFEIFIKLTGDDEDGIYVNAYLGVVYPTLSRVVFGDSIAYIPTFTDEVKLPNQISVPSTIEFISEGAFINVTSPTKLIFSGSPVFESGFIYNDIMLSANGKIQPSTNDIDYDKKGIKLIPITIEFGEETKKFINGDYVDLNRGQIERLSSVELDLDSFKKTNSISELTSADFRVGYTDDYKIYQGKAYYCKFVVKLYSHNRLVGYCSIYYREADVKI